ncbi:MAG TPA: HAMP domain-containing sensor histidine kinase [Silvibacterium sp.]|nr:HAMP domain-containing sensor histidine kinase [Silvibacterium sp.]
MAAEEELRVLLVAPVGRDAELICAALGEASVECTPLEDVTAAALLHQDNVGALLLSEEALSNGQASVLGEALASQAPWSALPVLVLTSGGKETFESKFYRRQRMPLGNTILLERPIRVSTLVNAVNSALVERARQFDRKRAEIALRQAEKLAAVGRVASSIAHEINNPLEAITNLLFILGNTSLNEDQRKLLNMAQSELTRVSQIAAQTLAFNRQRDVKGDASIAALLDSVLVLYHGRLTGSKVSIERRYQNTAAFTCYPGELRQVFANLIGNAFDATRIRGGRIILRERAGTRPTTRQAGVRVTIADTGEGMPAKIKGRLFSAFTSSKGNNGTGLGLWISKGIIEKHRGTIRFRSSTTPGQSGTVFSIFIPFPELTKSNLITPAESPVVSRATPPAASEPVLRTA